MSLKFLENDSFSVCQILFSSSSSSYTFCCCTDSAYSVDMDKDIFYDLPELLDYENDKECYPSPLASGACAATKGNMNITAADKKDSTNTEAASIKEF